MQAGKVSKVTVYEWLKQENFRQDLKRQRDELIERALNSLKANIARGYRDPCETLRQQTGKY